MDMCEWKGPVKRTFRNILMAVCGFIALFMMLVYTDGAIDVLCCGAMWYALVLIVAYFIYNYRLPVVTDHVYSSWDLDLDMICWRIDMAMQRKGVKVVIDHWGRWVVFPLSPMSIFVRPGRKRTTVFVGPLTEENGDKVEALKAFVEAALGKHA